MRAVGALQEMKRATELDPLAPLYGAELGWMYWTLGRFEEAIQEAEESLQLNPVFPVALLVLGGARGALGMYEEAIAAHQKAAAVSPDWRWGLGLTWAFAGRKEEAKGVARDLAAENQRWNTFVLAIIHAALGEKAEACHWLEEAYQHRHSWIPWIRHIPWCAMSTEKSQQG